MARRVDRVLWAVASVRRSGHVCLAGRRRRDAEQLREPDERVLKVRVTELPSGRRPRRGPAA